MADSSKRSKAKLNKTSIEQGGARSDVAVTKKIPRSKCFCKEKAEEDAVVCEACGRWVHYSCVGLSAAIIESMEEEYPYYCPQCSFGRLYTLEKDMKEIKNEMAHLRKENRELREQLGELADMDPDSLAIESTEVNANAVPHENDEASRPTYSATLKRGLASQVVKINESIKKIERMQERKEKKPNLIFGNMPEEGGNDLANIQNLINNKMKCRDIEIKEVKRIGRRNEDRHRLLCVRLNSLRDKLNILKQGKALKGGSIFVTEDLTKEERLKKKDLLIEVKKIRGGQVC